MDCESTQRLTLSEEVNAVEASCRRALAADYSDIVNNVAGLPQAPNSWFELLSGVHRDSAATRTLARLAADAERDGVCPIGAVGRYGVLQACLVALPRLRHVPVDDSVSRQFCAMFMRVASRADGWGKNFDPGSDPFEEIARIVTLQRFHAGQSSFDIMALPRTWLLRVHPLDVPMVLREIMVGMGGLGPIVMPHLNYWRANPLMLLRQENERAMRRIARSVERQPRVRGVVAASWLYSIEVGEVSPQLSWVRNFYLDNGAFLVDIGPAPERSGFMIGSGTRRRLYAEGKFRPRNTLVLWRRRDILAWAENYSMTEEKPRSRAAPRTSSENTRKLGARRTFSSGQLTLLDCEPLMTYHPRRYWFNVFLVPSVVFMIVAGASVGMPTALVGLVILSAVIWLFQYFFLQ